MRNLLNDLQISRGRFCYWAYEHPKFFTRICCLFLIMSIIFSFAINWCFILLSIYLFFELVAMTEAPELDARKRLVNRDEKLALKQVTNDPLSLEWITNPSYAVCMAAIQGEGEAIEFISDPSYDLCLAAVRNRGVAIKHIKNQTEELCLEAIKNHVHSFMFVRQQTIDNCLLALREEERRKNHSSLCNIFKLIEIVDNPNHSMTISNLQSKKEVIDKMKKNFNE
jgi:hypothetical protein